MEHITDALELGERLDDAVLIAYALSWKAGIHHVYMESRDAVESGWRSADMLRSAGELWQLSTTLALVAFSAVWAGRFADVRRAAAEADEVAERLGNHVAVMVSGRGQGMADWSEGGDLAVLEQFTHRDMQLCTDAGLQWISWSWSWLATVAFLRGEWDTALAHAAKAEELSPPGVINGAEWALRLEYCAWAGRREEVSAMLAARRAELPRFGQPCGWGGWVMLGGAIESLVVLGETDTATELYPLVRWCMERTGSVILMQSDCKLLERLAGMAAAAGSDWEVAEAHFQTALEQAETLPHRPEQAHTRRVYADMLLRRNSAGDRERARMLLAQAEMLYRAMAMPKHTAMAQALAARS
jgi:tetratricopeptide (TPR) repeat protein